MLIFRYLAKEVFFTLIACMSIVLFILVSNQLGVYYQQSLSGNARIPGLLILKFLLLEMPIYMSFLFPLGFYISIILVYGRLYNENEMLILQACGLASVKIYQFTCLFALFTSLVVASMLYVNPVAAYKRQNLLHNLGIKELVMMFKSQEFKNLPDNRVIYIDNINRQHTKLFGLFSAQYNIDKSKPWTWEIISADNIELFSKDAVTINKGQIYRISFDAKNLQFGIFSGAKIQLPKQQFHRNIDYRTWTFTKLWKNKVKDHKAYIELEWRFSLIFVPIILAFILVPLSIVKPRKDKYSKVFPSILIYLIYTFLLFRFYDAQLWSNDLYKIDYIMLVHMAVLALSVLMYRYQKRYLIL